MSIANRITLTHISNIIRNAGKSTQVPLGRWKVCEKKNAGLIADYSNEDHCGTCNYIVMEKLKNEPKIKYEKELHELDYTSLIVNSPG